ncbi:hypothetical protein FACS189415_0720 [Bacteroidia bacterium]|nr:hypothetical protein FACS189415_0720 [Bacteroidia bacterium]
MKKYTFIIVLCLTVSSALQIYAQQRKVSPKDIQWESYLANHDLTWNRITNDYYAGSIMGNGLLGANFYKLEKNSYRLNIGRVDVTEGRGNMPDEIYPKTSVLYDEARLPIGYFTLTTQGTVNVENMRLSLYDAATTGQIATDKGAIDFKTYVHSQKNYILFETNSTGGEKAYTWSWVPQIAESPRLKSGSNGDASPVYTSNPNPAVEIKTDGDYHLSIQKLFSGKT